jgi:hypothetical protein
MKKVYVAHPFGGLEENKEKVEALILRFIQEYPHTLFISPIHATGFYYHDLSYGEGIGYCFELLDMCDELWLTGDWQHSVGCNLEKTYAEQRDKRIVYYE